MSQDTLFTEDIYDALKDAVRALGGNKEVGVRLRPELASNNAGDWLKDCLNPKNRHVLDPQQIMWIIREAKAIGCHSIVHFICDDAGYARTTPIEPIDEAAELLRRGEALGRELSVTVKRLERLKIGGGA